MAKKNIINAYSNIGRKVKRRNKQNKPSDIKDRFFIFEIIDSRTFDVHISKLSYRSVFDALSLLMDYCVEFPLVAKFNEMLEFVAASPTSVLFDNEDDINSFYCSVSEYVQSLCSSFFNSDDDMLDCNVDNRRLSNRKTMVNEYKDAVHVFAQWLFIFGLAVSEGDTILVYADFMDDESLSGIK